MNSISIRDYGITPGTMCPGRLNSITDVPGVTVGHCTVDNEQHKTGVTIILPAQDNLYLNKMVAAGHVINGFGKTLGFIQLDELGVLETPIALTGTTNVGKVHEALTEYAMQTCKRDGLKLWTVNPLVGETNDAYLNDVTERAVGINEVMHAIEHASVDFAQGDVGAGKGTTCYGFKGGIGTASRIMELDGKNYTMGALVQSNFGATRDFTPGGIPVGPILQRLMKQSPPTAEDKGSIMMILATDLPLTSRQLHRICKRAAVGLARTGSYLGHGSGDVVMAFSTPNRIPHSKGNAIQSISMLDENLMDIPFRAAAEAIEEAVLNSATHADTVYGNGHVRPALNAYLPQALQELRDMGYPF